MKCNVVNRKIKILKIAICLLMACIIIPVSAQDKRALVIGISDYQQAGDNAWGKIHGSNDVELITPILQQQGFKVQNLCNKSATAKKIRKAINDLESRCQHDDIVYIHFSCHGQPFEDENGDEEDGWDESIVPYDALMIYNKEIYEGENHITDDELNEYFQKIRRKIGTNGFLCVVIDACHAGGASRGEIETDNDDDEIFIRGSKRGFSPKGYEYRPRINATGNFQIPKEAGIANIMVMEACRSYQSNYEIKQSGKYYGPLSYYVSQVLLKHKLSCSTDWVMEVRKLMNSDRRLIRQNMVFETSI